MPAGPLKTLLALDTCGPRCAAAVFEAHGDALTVRAEDAIPMERGHAEAVVPMAGRVMADAGIDFPGLDCIAVTVGPGSFTGVRIGIAAARGFALAHVIPMAGIGVLDAIAETVRSASPGVREPLAIALDARRGEVYLQSFADGGGALDEPIAIIPGDAVSHIPQGCRRIAGSGAAMIQEAAAPWGRAFSIVSDDAAPSLRSIARLALNRSGERGPPFPVYLRPPDAKPQTRAVKVICDG